MNAHESVDVVFLNFSKAFDFVNNSLLCVKSRADSVHIIVVEWIQSILAQRSSRVSVRDFSSLPIAASSAIPQGSVLGFLLFLLFESDLPDLLEGKILLFADDYIVQVAQT